MTDEEFQKRIRLALDAVGAYRSAGEFGGTHAAVVLDTLITGGQRRPDPSADIQGAADFADKVRRREADLILGLLTVADDLVRLREKELGQPPLATIEWLRRFHSEEPSSG